MEHLRNRSHFSVSVTVKASNPPRLTGDSITNPNIKAGNTNMVDTYGVLETDPLQMTGYSLEGKDVNLFNIDNRGWFSFKVAATAGTYNVIIKVTDTGSASGLRHS